MESEESQEQSVYMPRGMTDMSMTFESVSHVNDNPQDENSNHIEGFDVVNEPLEEQVFRAQLKKYKELFNKKKTIHNSPLSNRNFNFIKDANKKSLERNKVPLGGL